MALQAERAHIAKIALAATFYHWHDVIRIPKAAANTRPNAPLAKRSHARGATKPPNVAKLCNAVQPAQSAHTFVTFERPFP
jgi:hypothetical protein